jgi:putative oxidoreductase
MTSPATNSAAASALPVRTVRALIATFQSIPYAVIALAARIFPAAVFWQSGQTKVEGWMVSENAIALFAEEYKLPLISPWLGAHLAAFAEHFFPLLLVIGLASRFSALALLGMTTVIQVLVYPGAWPTHGVWAACFLLVIARGPGAISFDAAIARAFALR